MRLVFLGPNGSGKGTQATRLREHFRIAHISTGDLLRAEVAADTPLGLKAKAVMEAGQLVSDDIVLGMLESRLAQPDTANGFILDGYPRNLAQAHALDALLARIGQPLDAVVKFAVPDEVITGRCEIRYAAEGRADDEPTKVRKRLAIYHSDTAPIAELYRARGMLAVVDGVGPVDEVFGRIVSALPQR